MTNNFLNPEGGSEFERDHFYELADYYRLGQLFNADKMEENETLWDIKVRETITILKRFLKKMGFFCLVSRPRTGRNLPLTCLCTATATA